MERRKVRVLATAMVALLLIVGGGIYEGLRWPPPHSMETAGFPSVGKKNAKVEVVLFEDFRCLHCCTFSREIYPKIKSRYIDSGDVRYVVVPLAFLNDSKPIANAALAVYKESPSRFFAYIEEIFLRCQTGKRLDGEALLHIARAVGGINLTKLEDCIESRCYYAELDKNLEFARKVMGKNFGTPSLYVNGVPTSTASFRPIETRIDQFLKMKEKR